MNVIKFLFPFTYFFATRLQSLKDKVFHGYYEYLAAFLLLLYFSDFNIPKSIEQFLLAYFAFIAIYEIGYLGNDVYSVRYETHPKLRLKNFNPSNLALTIWIVFRIAVFLFITYWLDMFNSLTWWTFYAVVILFFYLHNVLKNKELKTFTFVNLAVTRFLAPVFIYLTPEQLQLILPSVLLNYVLYRTLTYMDSKKLLIMPTRTTLGFKVNYYLLIGGVSILIAVFFKSMLPIYINAYFLVFWIAFYMKEKSVTAAITE